MCMNVQLIVGLIELVIALTTVILVDVVTFLPVALVIMITVNHLCYEKLLLYLITSISAILFLIETMRVLM